MSPEDLKRNYPEYYGQIKHATTIPKKDASTIPSADVLEDQISSNIEHDLFTHQAEALNRLEDGEHVCVATSTSSGKTMVYALQIARNKLENPDSTALLVYPTKALSRDQENALNTLYNNLGIDISVQVYDGDTRQDRRKRIRSEADVIITNFSGVNSYLYSHSLWNNFYEDIELVAIDESHIYTGIQGMHVAWILRRLRRVVEHYGADPQFVMTSATIGNPAKHSENLTGVDEVTVVDNDGSPQARRDIVFWQPPIQYHDGVESGQSAADQKPADKEASELMAHLTMEGLQSMMFTRSRKQTELNAERARNAVKDHPYDGNPSIESYNAGHGKKTRRGVENQLKDGNLEGVISTNALELGIDIGTVDATVLAGYPGTRQSFWQQLGRAGRGNGSALGLLVSQHDSIDQYILENPEFLLDDDNIERAVIDLENNFVFARHLLCASEELPLTHDDAKWFTAYRMEKAIDMWKDAGKMVGTLDGGVQYNGPPRPQRNISMYSTSDIQFEIRCDDEDVDMEPISRERAYRDFHEGAIALNKGQQYEVIEMNEDTVQPYVRVQPVNVDYYTQSLSETDIANLESMESRQLTNNVTLHWGKGTVNVHYDGYKKKNIGTGKADSAIYPTDLPTIEMQTQLMWVEVGDTVVDEIKNEFEAISKHSTDDIAAGGLHALEHGIISLTPLELRMDKQDLGGLTQLMHPECDGNAVFFIYDGVSGGVGFAREIFNHFDEILDRTKTMINSCSCPGVTGCPGCVMEHNCGNNNEPLHTHSALSFIDKFNS